MHRELATDVRDLPHAFVEKAGGVCFTCERRSDDVLHHHITIEQASDRAVLQTEKGS